MRWYEYKMEVDDLHASDDLKAKLLAMQNQQTAQQPTMKRKAPALPAKSPSSSLQNGSSGWQPALFSVS